jgi:hypothetical protein
MSADVYLVIFSPALEAVVVRRWIGGSRVRDAAEARLGPPDRADETEASMTWRVRPREAVTIAKAHYADGATPRDVRGWATEFPEDAFWWSVVVGY